MEYIDELQVVLTFKKNKKKKRNKEWDYIYN